MSASWLPAPLIPPFRFGTVEPEVYRGAYPKQRNLRYLKRLKLKTILSLVPDEPDEIFQEFCREQGIQPIHLSVDKVKDNVPLTYNRAVEAVQIVIDPENLPIYIHCLDGAVVTGLVVCCLRKLQTWNISSAMGEFLRFLRGGVISSEESVFVEKFGSEIEISKPIPPWLWEGQVTFKKHPTLKLKFTIPPEAASSTVGAAGGASSSNVVGSGGGANAGNNGSTSSSPNMPGSHHGGTAVVFPGQSDGGTGGQLVNSSSANSISSLASTGSVSAGAGGARTNNNNTATSTAAAAGSGLMNHASRSSAKGASRDRPGTSKSNIWTDLQGQSNFGPRSNSIATPTTAAQAQVRGKRAIVGTQGSVGGGVSSMVVGGGDHGMTENSGLGVRMNLGASGAEGSDTTEFDANGQPKSALISVIHDQGDREQYSSSASGATSKDSETTTKETTTNTTTTASNSSNIQERSSGAKNSPASTPAAVVGPEVVDEYYEVSMTLKALALEGADF
ncbi:hypothetical protein BGZ95_010394 [Linnemannia exigua]|uniref:Uncharacterized protein n=1 Tax=Linnemannia exigua TaxID=604196 RepID=A0AAD4DBW7_9FUNG|nr:hypothetical protein BGZ95_010394 [Linnemannia exigua]